jgi:hypothetical protein
MANTKTFTAGIINTPLVQCPVSNNSLELNCSNLGFVKLSTQNPGPIEIVHGNNTWSFSGTTLSLPVSPPSPDRPDSEIYAESMLISTGNGDLKLQSTGNITLTGVVNLGSNANVKITGGSAGQSLTTDGTGNLSWTTVAAVTPTYGQFWSNVTQTVASANTEYQFVFNNTNGRNNVQLGTGVSNSRVIINQTGLYNIQFSAQIDKSSGGGTTSTAYIWFKKNGTAIVDSAGFFTLDNAVQAVQSWNILTEVTTPGDYYEIAYAASATNFNFPTLAGNVAIGYPASPSIIITVTPIGA